MDTYAEILRLANSLELSDDPDELGKLDHIIRTLSALRRVALAELDGPKTGKEYRITEGNSADRSYNTAGLMAAFGAKGWQLADLLASDAVRIKWQWTNLKRAAQRADVTLTIAGHEVEDEGDIDEDLVGEVWTSKYRIEGIDQ